MKCSGAHLLTPIYLKLDDAMPWPEQERAFYVLSRDGLFLCRNTPFFRSCVPMGEFPSELAGQAPFMKLSYPRIPRRLMERVIGFFDLIGDRHASEAAVLIAWNRAANAIEIVVPDQVGLVGKTWSGRSYPIELKYEVPALPPHLALLGDIHSHVDGPAYASSMDRCDEVYRPGLHIVVGRILDEPPQIHCEATADGYRFSVRDLSLILEGYHRRRIDEVPPDWVAKVAVKPWSSTHQCDSPDKAGPASGAARTSPPSLGSGSSGPAPQAQDRADAAPKPEESAHGTRASSPPPCSCGPMPDDAPSPSQP